MKRSSLTVQIQGESLLNPGGTTVCDSGMENKYSRLNIPFTTLGCDSSKQVSLSLSRRTHATNTHNVMCARTNMHARRSYREQEDKSI